MVQPEVSTPYYHYVFLRTRSMEHTGTTCAFGMTSPESVSSLPLTRTMHVYNSRRRQRG